MNPLRKIRRVIALLFLSLIALLFLDFTGTLHTWLSWLAKVQFMPALLALNFGIVVALIVVTLLFGRIYCSVICPMGVYQDLVSRVAAKRHKNRFAYSSEISWLRYGTLALFIIAVIAGIGSLVSLLEPYSGYGRIVTNLLSPLYLWGNNLLAYFAERADSYAFYNMDVWMKGIGTFAIALATLIIITLLAWRSGRSYCNAICPVGTILGFLSRFSIYKHRIDTEKCNSCGLCARNCKSSCIDPKAHEIDHSRCVSCFDCIDRCNKSAISFSRYHKKRVEQSTTDTQPQELSRRNMLTVAGALVVASVAHAQEKKVDGGLAFIADKKIPRRTTPIVPPGSQGIRHFTGHCTGCQLCVSACTNEVLRPSTGLTTFMQPEVSYERGYCRSECTKCSEVCPTGAIQPITVADKSATQIGHAVWIEKNCVVLTDGVACGNCERHCPTGAIMMAEHQPATSEPQMIPIVNIERCIGCGACENLCPARPFSAIYVEGHTMHRTV